MKVQDTDIKKEGKKKKETSSNTGRNKEIYQLDHEHCGEIIKACVSKPKAWHVRFN